MTGKWKKAAAVLLAAVMAVLLVPLPTYAKETAKISVGSGSCDIGDEVTISVSVSSSVDIYMCDIWLSYDSGVLQPVSGYSGGGGGSVRLLSTDSTSFSVRFKAVSAGSSSISVSTSNTIISSADEDYMAVSAGSGSVTVKAPVSYSTDNTLASLDISPGVLSPAFSPNVTSYTTTVGSDCSQLVVSAVANDENASVSVRGTRMDPGSNTTTITVTAQDGSKKVYTISTTKDDSAAATTKADEQETTKAGEQETTTVSSEEPTQSEEQIRSIQVAGAQYELADDYTANPLPSGYDEVDYEYNGITVKAGKGVNTKLILMYLKKTDGKGTSGFYVYDSVAKTFSLYIEASEPDITYAVLPITDSMEKPDGYKKTTYTIGGQTADVLMSEDGSYCLFYGVSSLGVTGWFRYDCNDNTIQVYSVMSAPAGNLTTQTESQGVSAASDRMWKVVTLVLSAVVVLCIIVIVMLAVKLSKSKRAFAAAADDGYDRYDDDEYDFDSYEEDDDEDLSEDVLADKEDEIQEDDEDEVVRSISEALKKNEDDLEVLDIQDVDDVDDVKRT